jgi:hypothetical protein
VSYPPCSDAPTTGLLDFAPPSRVKQRASMDRLILRSERRHGEASARRRVRAQRSSACLPARSAGPSTEDRLIPEQAALSQGRTLIVSTFISLRQFEIAVGLLPPWGVGVMLTPAARTLGLTRKSSRAGQHMRPR